MDHAHPLFHDCLAQVDWEGKTAPEIWALLPDACRHAILALGETPLTVEQRRWRLMEDLADYNDLAAIAGVPPLGLRFVLPGDDDDADEE